MNSAEALTSAMRTSIVLTELQHSRVQLRIVTALLLSTMFFALVDPATYILTLPASLFYRIAVALHQPVLLAQVFVALAVTLIPHFLVQIFWPECPYRRDTCRVAVFGLFGAGALWIFLAWFIWGWDVPSVVTVFMRLGLGAIAFSLVLAFSLNSEMARQYMEPT